MDDNELDELLESALNDFNKNKEEKKAHQEYEASSSEVYQANKPSEASIKINKQEETVKYDLKGVHIEKTDLNIESTLNLDENQANSKSTIDDDMKLFDEIFNDEQAKETIKQFKDVLETFKIDEPNMLGDFEKMMQQLTKTEDLKLYEDDIDEDDDREQQKLRQQQQQQKQKQTTASNDESNKKPLDKLLENINKKSEKLLKNDGNPNSSLFNEEFLLSQLNLNAANGDDEDDDDDNDPESSLLMQPLISMLFSKDILYPSLKMMLDNYEKYLESNKEKLNEAEMKKCAEQKQYIHQMCNIYENSKDSDSQEIKSNQLKQLLDLLEKCGHPPKELVPEINPFSGMAGGDFMKNGCPIS